jgi:hypothetical protein
LEKHPEVVSEAALPVRTALKMKENWLVKPFRFSA